MPAIGLGIRISAGAGGALEAPAEISLSANTVLETASVGTLVGILSVSGGSGSYTFTLTDDAGGMFSVDIVDDTRLEVADTLDYETATSHSITVQADNGVDTPTTQIFTVNVTDVFESGDDIQGAGILLTGVYGWA